MTIKPASITALAAGCLVASTCHGQLLNNLSMGNPKALGLAHAVTADPPGIDSIHFNPAGLSRIQGRQLSLKLLIADIQIDSSFGEPTQPTDIFDGPYDPNDPDPAFVSGKQLFYDLTAECQSLYPIAGPNDLDQVASAHDQCWGVDPVANTSISTGDPVLMVPFLGLQKTPILALPMGGVAVEAPGSNWTFGTAAYVSEGVGYTRELDEAGAFQGHQLGLARLTYFSPTVALQITERLAVGFGLTFSYQGLGVKTKFRAPGLTLGFLRNLNSIPNSPLPNIGLGPYDNVRLLTMELEDMFSLGFGFGLLWEANSWLTLGFSYRSESTSEMEGDYSMENTDTFVHTMEGLSESGVDLLLLPFDGAPVSAAEKETGTVKAEWISPQAVSFGASMQVLPALKINLDAKWIEFSRWDDLTFEFDRNNDFLILGSVINTLAGLNYADPDRMLIPREYEDTWSWAVGAEYQWNDNLVLRAGYEPRRSAIPDDRTDLLFPITHTDLYTAGFGWQYDKITRIEGALGYLQSESDTDACGSRNANSCVEGDVVYNPLLFHSVPQRGDRLYHHAVPGSQILAAGCKPVSEPVCRCNLSRPEPFIHRTRWLPHQPLTRESDHHRSSAESDPQRFAPADDTPGPIACGHDCCRNRWHAPRCARQISA